MTSWQLIRWCLAAVAVAMVVVSQAILLTVNGRRDGQSQWAVLRWFRAVRVYSTMLAVNMGANAITGHANDWALYLFAGANVYLLYSLVAFWALIRGRRLP